MYAGAWRGGARHGTGTCVYADGGHYEGEWWEGAWGGEGALTLPNGGGRITGRFRVGGSYEAATVELGELEEADGRSRGRAYSGGLGRGNAEGEGELRSLPVAHAAMITVFVSHDLYTISISYYIDGSRCAGSVSYIICYMRLIILLLYARRI